MMRIVASRFEARILRLSPIDSFHHQFQSAKLVEALKHQMYLRATYTDFHLFSSINLSKLITCYLDLQRHSRFFHMIYIVP